MSLQKLEVIFACFTGQEDLSKKKVIAVLVVSSFSVQFWSNLSLSGASRSKSPQDPSFYYEDSRIKKEPSRKMKLMQLSGQRDGKYCKSLAI